MQHDNVLVTYENLTGVMGGPDLARAVKGHKIFTTPNYFPS
jgi:hypothetical protein